MGFNSGFKGLNTTWMKLFIQTQGRLNENGTQMRTITGRRVNKMAK